MLILRKKENSFSFKIYGQECKYDWSMMSFFEYVHSLELLFQQDKMNVSFREMARLIAGNPLVLKHCVLAPRRSSIKYMHFTLISM